MNHAKDNSGSVRHYFMPIAAILILSSLPVFKGLWDLWHCDKNFDGLLLVPFMCGFVFYKNKDDFAGYKITPVKPLLYLLPVSLGAMLAASAYGLPRIAGLMLVVNLLIASLGLFGFSNLRRFAGPMLFLILMVPPPQLAVDFVTVHLQKFFSTIIEAMLYGFSDLFLVRQGFEFWFAGMDYPMVIAPECSGIRSLIGFVTMSSFFAVLDRHTVGSGILLITVGAIAALALNFIRIFTTMQLRLNGLEQYSVGSWHGLLGIAVFMVGCLTISRFSNVLKPASANHKENKK